MSVTIDQIVEILLLESGQYISDLDATLLDIPKIELMIKRELGIYSRYMPNKVTTQGHLYDKKVFTVELDGCIPNNIVDIRTDRFNFVGYTTAPIPGPVHSYYWRYDKPVLYFRYPEGEYLYSYIAPHVYDETNKILPTIEIHSKFITMLMGRFLMSVGKSRRAFTIDEIPINTDADSMLNEGKDIYDSAIEEVRLNSAFNLAVLV